MSFKKGQNSYLNSLLIGVWVGRHEIEASHKIACKKKETTIIETQESTNHQLE